MYTIILVILILALAGSLPTWPYSAQWGYYPASGLSFIIAVVFILMLFR